MAGKHIEVFLVDGTPGGLTTAEIVNWTGHVLSAQRSDMSKLLARSEVQGTCVYLLLGEHEGEARAYIGETDEFPNRLRAHHANKAFWNRVVVITSKDANLTKAHGRYLESQLVRLARLAGRVGLENGNEPGGSTLPEAGLSDMDYFIEQLKIVLPVLGVDVIRVPEVPEAPDTESGNSGSSSEESPVFRLTNSRHGYDAKAQQIGGEFVLLAGSVIAASVRASDEYTESTARAYAAYAEQHARLVADGAVVVDGETARTMRNIPFTSPSAAGAIVEGRSCNGREAWKTADGRTFGNWESRGVDVPEPVAASSVSA